MKPVSVEEAVKIIPDGATLMVGGFMGVGTPERLIDELVRQGKRNLTVIANDTAMPGQGIGKLVDARDLWLRPQSSGLVATNSFGSGYLPSYQARSFPA